jgi:cell division cycle 20-like protein 1 (cofactor of APC complex)
MLKSVRVDLYSVHSFFTAENLAQSTYNMVLRSELLGSPLKDIPQNQIRSPGSANMFKFKATIQAEKESPYSLSPISEESQKLLSSPRKPPRKIGKTPVKVLEAPAIQDDFYLNLVDWSSQNVLAVGLNTSVYLWNASTSQVVRLCDVGEQDSITSVGWVQRGSHLAVGTNRGNVQIWDVNHSKQIRDMGGHKQRVGAIAWNSHIMSSGSRDRTILHRDVRDPADFSLKLIGHKQEVCGLKWSFDNTQLASGGNDNKLLVWDARNSSPLMKFSDHTAAVKAIAWNPHQRGVLASGGGTADRCIRFWNTIAGTSLSKLDTGSQVCNLAWSKNVNELVSTHGYSQNQVVVWSYPSMTQIATLTGHTMRVLYLAVSPDGQTIVTGAGDETLRFWNVFPLAKGNYLRQFETVLDIYGNIVDALSRACYSIAIESPIQSRTYLLRILYLILTCL